MLWRSLVPSFLPWKIGIFCQVVKFDLKGWGFSPCLACLLNVCGTPLNVALVRCSGAGMTHGVAVSHVPMEPDMSDQGWSSKIKSIICIGIYIYIYVYIIYIWRYFMIFWYLFYLVFPMLRRSLSGGQCFKGKTCDAIEFCCPRFWDRSVRCSSAQIAVHPNMGVSENRLNPEKPNGFADHYPYEKWL